jgi:hypothetical protein
MLQLFERVPAMRVAVVGDVMLDRYLIGDAERLSPEAKPYLPETFQTVDEEPPASLWRTPAEIVPLRITFWAVRTWPNTAWTRSVIGSICQTWSTAL